MVSSRRSRRITLVMGCALPLGLAVPSAARAQFNGPVAAFRPQAAPVAPAPAPGTRLRLDLGLPQAPRRDFRWAGTAIGGVGLAIPAALAGRAYCGNSENGPRSCGGTTLGFAVGGGVIGGLVGHFVGRAIRRASPPYPASQYRNKTINATITTAAMISGKMNRPR